MKKLVNILIISLAVLTIAGISIGIVVLNDQSGFEKDITLSENGTTKEELSVNLEGLYPGQSAEYTVHFGGKSADMYDLELSFTAGESTELAQYILLEIELNGESISSRNLNEYLGGETAELPLRIDAGGEATLVLRYSMPSEVGNEAQRLTADFTVDFTAVPRN